MYEKVITVLSWEPTRNVRLIEASHIGEKNCSSDLR
jgi:hypothetical protein